MLNILGIVYLKFKVSNWKWWLSKSLTIVELYKTIELLYAGITLILQLFKKTFYTIDESATIASGKNKLCSTEYKSNSNTVSSASYLLIYSRN